MSESDWCMSCGEPGYQADVCPQAQRPCGHHCNHIEDGSCHWCGHEDPEDIGDTYGT